MSWRWPQSDADWPRLLPKWPFEPVLIQGGPLPDDDEALDEIDETDYTYAWPGTIDPTQALPAIEVVQFRSFRYGPTRRDRPFDGFPHDWNAVRITTGLIAEGMGRIVSDGRRYFPELSDDEICCEGGGGARRTSRLVGSCVSGRALQ